MIEEISRVHGPLELADPNIMQPLSSLPDRYQDIISSAGGLRAILEKSYKFVFYQNEVMLQEYLLENMKKLAENSFLHSPNGMNAGEISLIDEKLVRKVEQWVNSDVNVETSSSQSKTATTKFNPDAKEFVPAPSQTDLLRNSPSVTHLVTLQETEARNEESLKKSTITKEWEPVSSECKVKNPAENTIENVVTDVAGKNVKSGDNGDGGDEGTKFKEEVLEKDVDLSKATCNFAPAKETFTTVEGTAMPLTSHKRKGSNITAIESAVVGKEKSVQTQPSLKSKCVGTEPSLEPFKAEYQRVVAEKDACQISLRKSLAEVEKVKKELSDVLEEKEVRERVTFISLPQEYKVLIR